MITYPLLPVAFHLAIVLSLKNPRSHAKKNRIIQYLVFGWQYPIFVFYILKDHQQVYIRLDLVEHTNGVYADHGRIMGVVDEDGDGVPETIGRSRLKRMRLS